MNPVKPQNTKWAEIRAHGLLGRPLLPFFRPQNNRWLALVGLPIFGITLYWMFTYSGPYRYLAEFELKWIGSYGPELTAAVVFLGLFLGFLYIAVAIKFLFRGAERLVPGMPAATATTPVAANKAQEPRLPYLPFLPLPYLWARYLRSVLILFVCFVFFGMGAYSYYNGTHAGSLRQLNAVDFQSGKLRSHIVYADVRGHLSGHYMSKDYYLYIPMTSEKNSASPVQLLVGVQEHEAHKYLHREADGTYRVRGVADKGLRLDGDVKYAFEKNGIAMADTVWVMHAGRDPSGDRKGGLLMMGCAAALAGLVFAWQSYRKRKTAANARQRARVPTLIGTGAG
jgi:hypothetical protein